MQLKGLSLHQAPPFETVYRFFMTSIGWGVLGSILLIFIDYPLLWRSFEEIALVHLILIGIIGNTMIGALFQMLPVLTGAILPSPHRLSVGVWSLVNGGLFLFLVGFLSADMLMVSVGGVIMALGFMIFVIIALFALGKTYMVTAHYFQTALIFLSTTVILGVVLVALKTNLSWEIDPYVWHINVALMGWIFLLIVGVSYQVVPMFYVTQNYPFRYGFMGSVVLLLMSYGFDFYYDALAFMIVMSWGGLTWYRFATRKRKTHDTTLLYWKTTIILLGVGLIVGLNDVRGGVFFMILGVLTLIKGMSYKIIPFLTWFHLTNKGFFNTPTMKELIPEHLIRYEFGIYLLSLISLSLVFMTHTYTYASFFIGSSFLLWGYLLWRSIHVYRKMIQEVQGSS